MTTPAMRPVAHDVVEAVRAGMAGTTGAALMTRFGISYNTWRKVQAGDAIRASVADRLEQRLRGGAG